MMKPNASGDGVICESDTCDIVVLPPHLLSAEKHNTVLPKGFIDTMRTSKGVNVAELTVKHKVMLLFLRHTKCCFCTEAINDICDNYQTLLQLNTIPILVHMETSAYFDQYLLRFENPIIRNIMHIHDDDNRLATAFDILDGYRKKDIPKMLIKRWKLRIKKQWTNSLHPPEGVSARRMPALFILENKTIVHEFRHMSYATRPDYLRFLIDPEREGAGSDIRPTTAEDLRKSGAFVVTIPKSPLTSKPMSSINTMKRRSLHDRRDSSFIAHQRLSCHCAPIIFPKAEEKIEYATELEAILYDKAKRRYFHLFASTEHSVENVLFWEEANVKYTQAKSGTDRLQIALSIIDTFFDANALLGINVSEMTKNDIQQRLQQEGPTTDLFKKMVREIEGFVLLDTYNRFKDSLLCKEMNAKLNKK